ncbi:hypothetical protein ACIBI3_44620 [Actinomadura luteofluorescens]|uniref:hypothetical protein n=1 Tax=Actinomadura luteofluorescens TaxID=46163 RepID=UPI003476A033
MRKVTEDKRLTLLVSFVRVVATGVRDDVVTMFCNRMAAIHKKGREHLEELREVYRAESERLLGVFGDVLSVVREALAPGDSRDEHEDGAAGEPQPEPVAPVAVHEVAERAGRLVLKTLEQAGGVDALASAHEAVSAHHGNNYFPLLDQHYRSHRSALFTLANAIELEATTAELSVLEAMEFLRALRSAKAPFVPEEITVERPGTAGDPVKVRLRIDVDAFVSG